MITLFCIRPKGFNVGNDAIFIGLQHFLNEAFGEIINLVTVPATARYESQAKAGLTQKTIHEINQFADGVIVGGGNLYENNELDLSLDALEKLAPPLMLFSLSRGRIYNKKRALVARTDTMPDRVLKAINDRANISLARDQVTRDHLHKLGCEKVVLGGCPTIFLDRMVQWLPPMMENKKPGALISIRQPDLMNIPLELQARVRSDILEMVDLLHVRGYQDVKLLCHDHRDLAFAASFPGMEYIYPGDIFAYLAVLRLSSVNVSYRLHASLPCMAFGVPTVKISYDERAISLMDTLGLGAWNIDMVRCPDLPGAVADRLDRLPELAETRAALAGGLWTEFYARLRGQFADFARQVYAYKAEAS